MPKKKTILLIEDDPHFLEEVAQALAAEGFIVKTALDGESGLAVFKKEVPDAAILDLILPQKTGFDVLKAVAADPQTAKVPVIVLTNMENTAAVDRALALGAVGYLVKANYRLGEIVDRVKNVLNKHRL